MSDLHWNKAVGTAAAAIRAAWFGTIGECLIAASVTPVNALYALDRAGEAMAAAYAGLCRRHPKDVEGAALLKDAIDACMAAKAVCERAEKARVA